MKVVLDHVGIAVRDLDQVLAFYRDALGLTIEPVEEIPSQHVRAHFISVGGAAIELLEATSPDSAVGRFVHNRGPGLHHITLRVDDLSEVLTRLKASGVRLIDQEPRIGASGSLIAFVHPSSTQGVLLELKQTVAALS